MSDFIGKYDRDGFLITISPEIEIFNKTSGQIDWTNTEHVAVFTHEYWHFLLHFSTFTRVRDWIVYLSQISLFTKTLMYEANGISDGNHSLDTLDINFFEESFDYLRYQKGDFITGTPDFDDFIFISEPTIPKDLSKPKLLGKEIPLSSLHVDCRLFKSNQSIGIQKYAFSVIDIEESIADAIETMIYNGTANKGIKYNVIKKLFQYYNLDMQDYHLISSLGTMSLLTSDPPSSLINLIKDYKGLIAIGNSKNHSLAVIQNNIKNIIVQYLPILDAELDSICAIYKNREPLATATNLVIDRIRKLFKLRSGNPTFDTDCFISGKTNYTRYFDLINNLHRPVIAYQERCGDPCANRDTLITMDDTLCKINGTVDYPVANLFKVLSLLNHYYKAHYAIVGIMRSGIVDSSCVYLNSCDAPTRLISEEICISKPWSFMETGDDTCEYCQMVRCLIGETKIRNV